MQKRMLLLVSAVATLALFVGGVAATDAGTECHNWDHPCADSVSEFDVTQDVSTECHLIDHPCMDAVDESDVTQDVSTECHNWDHPCADGESDAA